MRRTMIILALALSASGVTGCTNPYDPGQRALGGGLIGGAGGAAVGGLAGGGTGALIHVDLTTGRRAEVFSNRLQTSTYNFDMPYDVVHNSCDNNFYVLHTGATGVLGNVLKVDGGTGARTLFATYTASSPPSNYSLLMRPLILLPGGGGPSGPSGPTGGGGL